MAHTLPFVLGAASLLLGACGSEVVPLAPDALVPGDVAGDDVDGAAPSGTGLLVALNTVTFPTEAHTARLRLFSPEHPSHEVTRALDQPDVFLYLDTIEPGAWLLTLEVLAPAGNTIFCGSRYVSILAGATTRADVILSPSGPCLPAESACTDGTDDDFDGDIDCADDDCAGQGCNDGNLCTLGDTCNNGACSGATPLACDDNQACTSDTCAPGSGCVFTPIAGCGAECVSDADCNDLGLCQGTGCHLCTVDHCVSGVCAHDPVSGTPCDDGDACTGNDTCNAGQCAGSTITPGSGPAEACNGADDDCDGLTDEPFGVGNACTDAPAFNECRTYQRQCSADQQTSVCAAVGSKPNGTSCGSDECADGMLVERGACQAGTCIIPAPQDCAPYACADATQCGTSCQTSDDCAAGFDCDGSGECTSGGALGAACTNDGECQSDHCADSVCCEEACDGACRGCDATGSCVLVAAQTDPDDECPGSCDGSGDFVDGVCGSAGACEPSSVPTDCGGYLCTADGCLTECAPTAPQCANGITCVDNSCCDGGADLDGGLISLGIPPGTPVEYTLCVGGSEGLAFGYTGLTQQIRRELIGPQGQVFANTFIGPGLMPEDHEPDPINGIAMPPGLYRLRLTHLGGNANAVTGSLRIYQIPSPGGGLASLDGTAVANTTLTIPGTDVRVTYPGVAGKYVSIRIAGLASYLTHTDPDGFVVSPGGVINTPMFIEPILVAKTGTYTMRFDPLSIATGGMTIQYWEVPPDLEATAQTDGTEVQQTITIPGRDAAVLFTGTAGTHVSIAAECPKSIGLKLLTSTGAQVGGATTGTEGIFKAYLGNLTLPTSGTYRVELDLMNDAAYDHPETIRTRVYAWGTDALATVPIDSATVVPAPYPGQRLQILFNATAGTRLSALLDYTGCALPDPVMNDPGGTEVGATDSYGACEGAFIPPVTIAQTGTYRIIVDFYGSSPPSSTVTISNVTIGLSVNATVNGASVGLPITKPGQLGRVTFSGTSGQVIRVAVTGTPIQGTTSYQVIAPSETVKQSFGRFGTFTSAAVTLDETGTWSVVVDPESRFTGTQTISIISP